MIPNIFMSLGTLCSVLMGLMKLIEAMIRKMLQNTNELKKGEENDIRCFTGNECPLSIPKPHDVVVGD